jgi:hypothetical protein
MGVAMTSVAQVDEVLWNIELTPFAVPYVVRFGCWLSAPFASTT